MQEINLIDKSESAVLPLLSPLWTFFWQIGNIGEMEKKCQIFILTFWEKEKMMICNDPSFVPLIHMQIEFQFSWVENLSN